MRPPRLGESALGVGSEYPDVTEIRRLSRNERQKARIGNPGNPSVVPVVFPVSANRRGIVDLERGRRTGHAARSGIADLVGTVGMEGNAARSVIEDGTRLDAHGLSSARTSSVTVAELDGIFPPDAVAGVVRTGLNVDGPGSAREAARARGGNDSRYREGDGCRTDAPA